MPLSQEQLRRIANVMEERAFGKKGRACVVCDHSEFAVVDGYVNLAIAPIPGRVVGAGRSMPCLGLVCTNCGYLHLFNTLTLGLADLGPLEGEAPATGGPGEA